MTDKDLAEMFEELAHVHDRVAEILLLREDVEHIERDRSIMQTERMHAESCRRSAAAFRDR